MNDQRDTPQTEPQPETGSELRRKPQLPRKSRWWRFSLRTLMVVTVIAGVGCGWFAKEVHRARSETETLKTIIERAGEASSVNVLYGHRFKETRPYLLDLDPEPTGVRAWLETASGVDIFRTVKTLTIYGKGNTFSYRMDDGKLVVNATYVTGLQDRDANLLSKLPYLEQIMLEANPAGDNVARQLSKLRQLKGANLGNTQITDEGMRALTALPNLKSLNVGRSSVSDDGLAAISQLPLDYLTLTMTNVSDDGVAEFRQQHPDCEIER